MGEFPVGYDDKTSRIPPRALSNCATMNTFDAIAHIRREALSRADALLYLMEHLGYSVPYAEEIVAVVFNREDQLPGSSDASRAAS